MSKIDTFLVDRDGDGFIDDATARIVVRPPESGAAGEYWATLIDAAALIGLFAQALPLPLFITSRDNGGPDSIEIQSIQDATDLLPAAASAPEALETPESSSERSSNLLNLFTISGLLADNDGDLVPDATRFGFALPEEMSAEVGAAICNLAVRIGLESGGVALPMVSDRRPTMRVRFSENAPRLCTDPDGWSIDGRPAEVALLIDEIAAHWPHFGHPETAGAQAGVHQLAAALVGGDERPGEPLSVQWEVRWSAEAETERLIDAVERHLIPHLGPESHLDVTVFACEPAAIRRTMERTLISRLAEFGLNAPSVAVLSAFKVGLSWLREVVLVALEGEDVDKLEIQYRRFEPATEHAHLDLPIRWLQELFPGDEIAARELGISVDRVTFTEAQVADAPTYQAVAWDDAQQELGTWELDLLSYSLPFMPNVVNSDVVQVTTGGFIANVDGRRIEHLVDTDLDRFWQFWQREALPRVIEGIEAGGGFVAARQPFFGALEVDVWLSSPNDALGVREENDSAAEALHEDIYFNTLDTLEVLGLNTTGERTSAPGAVVPIVHVEAGVSPRAVVRLREAPPARPVAPDLNVAELTLTEGELTAVIDGRDHEFDAASLAQIATISAPDRDIERSFSVLLKAGGRETPLRLSLPEILPSDDVTVAPVMDANIHGSAVESWSGRAGGKDSVSAWIEGTSYQGRPISALAVGSIAVGRVWSPSKLAALKPAVLVVARHHANEISSTNAALMLAHLCATDEAWSAYARKLNIVIIPYENADGAALHATLAAPDAASTWKHHPARYNALGHEFGEDYFNADSPYGEARVRPALWHRWLPDAMVDNHGVPSHEWVQPFAGFGSPPRFRVSYWIPQAVIYGIVRYVDDPQYLEHARAAELLREVVSASFVDTPVGELNREIGASYRCWGQERVPERFPGEFHNGMLWNFGATSADPDGRGFNVRYPKTTTLSWVTEVNDETATRSHLAMVAGAHLQANRAMFDVVCGLDTGPTHSIVALPDGRRLHRFLRKRPLGAS